VPGHEFQGQETAFRIDLLEPFADFSREVANTDLSLSLVSEPDPILLISVFSHRVIVIGDIRSSLH
jgi:hypothetical protein